MTVNKATGSTTLSSTSSTLTYNGTSAASTTNTFTAKCADGVKPTVSSNNTSAATAAVSTSADANGNYTITNTWVGAGSGDNNASSVITVNCAAGDHYAASSATHTVTTVKKENTLTLNETSGSVTYPTASKTFTVSTNTSGGTLSVSPTINTNTASGPSKVAIASLSGSTVTMTPAKSGTQIITVSSAATDYYKSASATYTLTVRDKTISINTNGGTGTCAGGSITCTYVGYTCTAPTWNKSTCAITNGTKTLDGWNTYSNGTGTSVALGGDARNVGDTLYAVWSTCSCGTDSYANCTPQNVSENACQFRHTCYAGYYNERHNSTIISNTFTCEPCTNNPDTSRYHYTGAATSNACPYELNDCQAVTLRKTNQMDFGGVDFPEWTNKTIYYKISNRKFYTNNTCTTQQTSSGITPTATGYSFDSWQRTVNDEDYPWQVIDLSSTYAVLESDTGTDRDAYDALVASNWILEPYWGCAPGYNDNETDGVCALSTYTITYNLNGGTNPANAPTSYNVTSSAITLPTPTKAGYTFAGWCDDSGLTSNCATGRTIPTGSTGNKTFYAKWTGNTIILDWDENGGSEIPNGTCTYGGDLTLPAEPSRTGYTFNGWSAGNTIVGGTAIGGCVQTLIGVTSGTSTSITARWTAKTYTCDAGTYLRGSDATCQPCPVGTYCPSTSVTYTYNGSDQGKTECEPGYYCMGGNVHNPCSAGMYSTGSATRCLPIDAGYYSSGGGTSATPSSDDCLSGQSCGQCPAGYRNIPAGGIEDCTGTFTKTGEQRDPDMPTSWYSRELAPSCTPETCEYTKNYAGQIVEDCTPAYCFKNQTATACKSSYYLNNGGCSSCSTLGGGLYLNSATPNSSGASACYASVPANQRLVNATDTDFTSCPAGYSHDAHRLYYNNTSTACTPNTITLDWDENGGSAIVNGTCTYGGDLTLPAAPTRTGYTFLGWSMGGSSLYSAGQTITNGCVESNLGTTSGTSTIIMAAWQAKPYTVSYFCGNGATGTAPSNTTAYYNSNFTPDANDANNPCAKSGYMFAGWNDGTTNRAAGKAFTWNYDSDKTLTAQWQQPKFTLTTTSLSANDTFRFTLSAAGTFYVDWGDGNGETIDRTGNTEETVYFHTYTTGGAYTIKFGGLATGYDNSGFWSTAIGFDITGTTNAQKIASIANNSDLSAMFPYIDENDQDEAQPKFGYTFANATNLKSVPDTLFQGYETPADYMFTHTFADSGLTSIPEDLFAGIEGAAEYLFESTFENCTGITEIPEDLFAGIEGAAEGMFQSTFFSCTGLLFIYSDMFSGVSGAATNMFRHTFYNCTSLNGIWITSPTYGNPYITYIPDTFLSNVTGGTTSAIKPAGNMFSGTGLAEECPTGTSIAAVSQTGGQFSNAGKPWCAPSAYTVTYSCGDGTGTAPANGTAYYDKPFTPAENTCTKTRYTFDRWAVSGANDPKRAGIPFQWKYIENKKFTAQWTGEKFTVKYSCGDGEGTPPSNQTATYEALFTPKANTCTRTGFVFNGWKVKDTDDVKEAGVEFTWNYESNKEFTAQWKFDDPKFSIILETTNSFSFAMGAKGKFYVDWGDGTIEAIDRRNATSEETYSHTYANADSYTVKFIGLATDYLSGSAAIRFNTSSANAQKIQSVSGDMSVVFPYITTNSPDGAQPRFAYTFSGASNIGASTMYIYNEDLDTMVAYSGISDTLFQGYTTPSTGMFQGTFQNCTGLSTIPSNLFSHITGAATGMFQSTFQGCTSLASIPSGLFSGVQGAADAMFVSTFEGCTSLASIPSGLFSGIRGAAGGMFMWTFRGCTALETIPENLFYGVNGAASSMFVGTFENCTKLNTIPMNLFQNVPYAVSSMFSATFSGCTSLNKIKNTQSGLNYSFIPSTFLGNIADGTNNKPVQNMFNNTGFAESCPNGTTEAAVSQTGGQFDDAGKPWCTSGAYFISYSCGTGSGTPPANTTVKYGDTFTPAANTCSKSGHTFIGWQDTDHNKLWISGETNTWTYPGGATFVALWQEAPFSLETTYLPAGDSFGFKISAFGEFYVDCGDGGTLTVGLLEKPTGHFTREDNDYATSSFYKIKCTWTNAGVHTIKIAGQATDYIEPTTYTSSSTGFWMESGSAITFNNIDDDTFASKANDANAAKIASVYGDLSAIFPYKRGNEPSGRQPRFEHTFQGAINLKHVPDTLFKGYTTPSTHMFYETFTNSGLVSVPSGLFSRISGSAVRAFYYTFKGCTGLTEIPYDLFSGVSSATTMMFRSTFSGCTNLASITNGQTSTNYIPATFLNNITGNTSFDSFNYMFYGTALADPCPDGTSDVTPSKFSEASKPWCTSDTYTVTYSCGTGASGNAPTTPNTATYGAPFTPAETAGSCAKTGYVFNGWHDGITYRPAGRAFTWIYTENKTLTAQWTGNISGAITLDDARYTSNDAQSSQSSDTHVAPTTVYSKYNTGMYSDSAATNAISSVTPPTMSGYTFTGFYTTKATGGTKLVNADGTFTDLAKTQVSTNGGTATWYARWEPAISGMITLDDARYISNEAEQPSPNSTPSRGVSPVSVYSKYGVGMYSDSAATAAISSVMVPEMTGYTFAGFYTTKATGGTKLINADGTFTDVAKTQVKTAGATARWYARWTPNTYTVTYACGTGATGTAPDRETVNYNDSYTPKANTCTRTGYVFAGWEVSNANNTIKQADTPFTWNYTSNKTFTAQWEPVKFTLTTTTIGIGNQFSFKLSAAGKFYVDWGDGKSQTIDRTNNTEEETYFHQYLTRGEHTINFAGTTTGYSASENAAAISFDTASRTWIASVSGTLSNMFPGTNSANGTPRFYRTFYGATGLHSLTGFSIGTYNTPTDYMFANTFANSGLTSIPADLFSGVSGAAANMFDSTFSGCTGITEIPSGLFGTVSGAAENMFVSTFEGCTGLTEIPSDLFGTVSGAAANMFDSTFSGCTGITSIPYNLFSGVSGKEVGMFESTFEGCTSLAIIAGQNINTNYIPSTFLSNIGLNIGTIGSNVGTIGYSISIKPATNMFNGTALANPCPDGTSTDSKSLAPDGMFDNAGKPWCTPNTYTVTYSCGDGEGTAPNNDTATFDDSFTLAANTCTRTGYTFAGWTVSNTNDMKRQETTFQWKYTENKQLTASWNPVVSGTITLDDARYSSNSSVQPSSYPSRGVSPVSVYTRYGVGVYPKNSSTAISSVMVPEMTGYTFAGFYTTKAASEDQVQVINDDGTFTPEASTQITTSGGTARWYARWIPNTINITLNANGATSGKIKNTEMTSNTITVTFTCKADAAMLLPTWSSTDSETTTSIVNGTKVFNGWSEAALSPATAVTVTTCPTEDKTYYAVWDECVCGTDPDAHSTCEVQNSVNNTCRYQHTCDSDGYYHADNGSTVAYDTLTCAACPAPESTWTQGTGTGWTVITQCSETKNATDISSYCSGGQIKKMANNDGTWGDSTISVAFEAAPGSIVSGQTCTQCTGATYSAGGEATSCSPCPQGYTDDTSVGKSANTQCCLYTNQKEYIATANQSPVPCIENSYCPGKVKVCYGDTGGRVPCETGLFAPAKAYRAAQCGHKFHVDAPTFNDIFYLHADKITTPSFNVRWNNKTWYANMVEAPTNMNENSEHKFKARWVTNTGEVKLYYVCDDTICDMNDQ